MRIEKIKPLSELPLKHDYMFGQVMRRESICKLFLEELLQKKIKRIKYINTQETFEGEYLYKGIRLDVYIQDEEETRYNIEMEVSRRMKLERRERHYQGCIDRGILPEGEDYDRMPDSYIIFVCDFDYFGAGEAYYERVSTINGNPDIPYDNGSHVIFLNSRYRTGNAPQAVLEFLNYIRTNDDALAVQSKLAHQVMDAVHDIRYDKSKEVEYMTLAMKLRDERKIGWYEGHEEGIEKGMERGIQAMVFSLRELSADDATITRMLCKQLGLTREEAENALERYKNA